MKTPFFHKIMSLLVAGLTFSPASSSQASAPGTLDNASNIMPAALIFQSDHRIESHGLITDGNSLYLAIAPEHFSSCGGNPWGEMVDGKLKITAHVKTDGQLFSQPMHWSADGAATTFSPIKGRSLEIWFSATRYGCHNTMWYSKNSQNFKYPIYRLTDIPLIIFSPNESPKVIGKLVAGKPVRLHYDLERLTTCRTGGYAGGKSWHIEAHGEVDGRPLAGIADVTDGSQWGQVTQRDVLFLLPQGNDLALWFRNAGQDYYHGGPACEAWDSNWGRNYHFAIEH
jgi:hypothetical protein